MRGSDDIYAQAQEVGRKGEEAAVAYLAESGFEIVERNWRAGRYEIDIIARRGEMLHIVEVKSRQAGALTTPEEAVTEIKRSALFRATEEYIEQNFLDVEVQLDLVAVEFEEGEVKELRYIENAIVANW